MAQTDCNILEERIYLSAYFLWLTNAIINITIWNKIPIIDRLGGYLSGTAMVLLLIQFLIKKQYILKDLMGIALIIGINILVMRFGTNSYVIYTIVFMYFSANIDYQKILRVTFGTQLAFMLCTVSVNLLRVRFNGAETLFSGGLGYEFVQYPAHILLFLTLMWGCLRKKIYGIEAIGLILLNGIMFIAADSRADFLLSIVAVVGFLYLSSIRNKRINKVCYRCMKYGIWPLAIGSIIVQWIYREDIDWMYQLNAGLTNRLLLGRQAIDKYGFSLFGSKIHWVGVGGHEKHPEWTYNYVDNVFLKETLSYGIFFLILILIAVFFTESLLLQKREYKLAWALFVMIGYGIINAHFDMVSYNPFILLLGMAFRKKETDEPIGESFLDGIVNRLRHLSIYEYRHSIRSVLLRLFFAYLLVLSMFDMGTVEQSYDVYVWISYVFIILISVFTYELQGNKAGTKSRTRLEKMLILFCCLAVISDVIINKTFRYASIGMIAFGGIFLEAWKSMEQPEVLVEDIEKAIRSIIVLCGAIEVIMLCRNHKALCDISTLVLLAVIGFMFGIIDFKQSKVISVMELGVACFLLIRCDVGQFISLYHGYIRGIYQCLKKITLWGHSDWPKYNGDVWRVNNSIVMNIYRYGLGPGLVYIGIVIEYVRRIWGRVTECSNIYHRITCVIVAVASIGLIMERPFISVGWTMLNCMLISMVIINVAEH